MGLKEVRRACCMVCMAALLWGMSACAASESAPGGTSTVAAPSPSPVATGLPAGARPCAAADLRAEAVLRASGNSLAGQVTLTNQSSGACYLQEKPRLELKDGKGRNLPTDKSAPRPSTVVPAGEVQPGQSATVTFVWSNWCYNSPPGPVSVGVSLPDNGGEIDAPALAPNGAPLADTPRCNDPGVHSTLNVGPFERAQETPSPS